MDPANNYEAGVLLTSKPALTATDECGVDLSEVATLPFRPAQLVRLSPQS